MKRIVLFLLCGLFPMMVVAQSTRPVRGVVFDASGVPMSGATLTAIGSTDKTTSSENGTFEMMVSPYTKSIEASKEGFISATAEVDGSYLVFKLTVDKKYLENKAKEEEAARLAAEAKAKAEEEARLAEERRIAAEKLAAEKAEQARLAAEAKAKADEEKRIEAERIAAEKAEQARLAAEEKARLAEEKRIAAEKVAAEKAEQARLAAEEKARIAEEKRIAAEKAAAEKAEQARLAAEAKARQEAEQARLAEEQRLAQQALLSEKEREALEAKRVAQEARRANNTEWKEASLKGYRSQVEGGFAQVDGYPTVNLKYIGGYQINNLFYVGAGTGAGIHIIKEREDSWPPKESELTLKLPMVSVPLFGYFRVNFAKGRFTPFVAVAAGYVLSTNKNYNMPFGRTVSYNTCGLMFDPQFGLSFRLTKKSDIYLSAGAYIRQIPSIVSDVTAPNAFLNVEFGRRFKVSGDFRIGFAF